MTNEDLRRPDAPWLVLRDHESSLEFDRRPVTALSFVANFQIAGLRPFGYRIVNLLLHWAAAIVLATVVGRLAARLGWSKRWDLGLVVGMLWFVHPIATNVTTYIYQRSELLMSLFFLLAILFLLKAGDPREGNRKWLGATYLAAVASALSKEPGIMLLFALPLIELVVFPQPFRTWVARRWPLYLGLFLTFAVLSLWFASGIRVHENQDGSPLSASFEYFKTQCGVLWRYLRLVVWPLPMIFFSQPRYVESPGQWVPQAIALCLLFGSLLAAGWRRRWLWIPVGCFLLVLAPTSSFYPIPLESEVGFRMYLPSACVISFLVIAGAHVLPAGRFGVVTGRLVTVVCLLSLAVCTFVRNQDHRTSKVFWASVVRHDPHNIKALNNLALEFLNDGEVDLAAAVARRLLEIGNVYESELASSTGRHIEALTLLEGGNPARAEQALADLAQSAPWLKGVELNHALALMRTGQLAEAQTRLAEVAEGKRSSPSFWMMEAELSARQGRLTEASEILEKLKRLGAKDSRRVLQLEKLIDQRKADSGPETDN